MSKPAAFFDRDGTLNVDKGYTHKISDFVWIDGAIDAIKYLNKKNYHVIVITNQSGLARNYYTEDDLIKLHNFMNSELEKNSAFIDDFFYSPYHPDVNNEKYNNLKKLRKPDIGMLELAKSKWNFSDQDSFLIGDKKSDVQCAINYGIRGYLFNTNNLFDFIKKIIL